MRKKTNKSSSPAIPLRTGSYKSFTDRELLALSAFAVTLLDEDYGVYLKRYVQSGTIVIRAYGEETYEDTIRPGEDVVDILASYAASLGVERRYQQILGPLHSALASRRREQTTSAAAAEGTRGTEVEEKSKQNSF